MEMKQLDILFLKTLLLCTAGIIMTQVLGLDDLTSLLFLLTFPLTVLLWMRSVRKTMTGKDLLMLLTSMLAFVNVMLDLGRAGGTLTFSYIKKLIMFTMTLMFLQTAHRIRVKEDMARFIDRIVDFLTVFLIFMYFADNSSMHLLNGMITRYLTFRFSNPNTTGLFLISLYMLELYRLFARERWYLKLIHIIMACFLGWFVLGTESRNCLLVLLMFTAACFWLEFRSRRKLRISRFWAFVIAWFPAAFVGVYMLFVYAPWVQKLLSFLVDVGKGLDSRTRIWTESLRFIAESPLIGSYHGISDGTGAIQLHNSHLDIAASYGIPVLAMVCSLLTTYLYQKGRYYEDKESFSYMLAFACAIMLGLGEAALFAGGLGIYIFAGIFLMLSSRETKK